jgi:subtilisin family serine protease
MERSRFALHPIAGTLALSALLACADRPPTGPGDGASASRAGDRAAVSYLILGAGGRIPEGLAERVEAAGGTLDRIMPEIGVAVATSSAPGFAASASRIAGVQDVAEDPMVQWIDPDQRAADAGEAEAAEADVGALAHEIGGHETFRLVQWAPDAVSAPEAWATGALGQGARVAILDGGIHATHVDIAPNLDVARSRSFVPGFAYNQDVGTFWHGTHVAGIVAAPANNIGTVGIAPQATIIGVKVLHNGSGAFSWIIDAIRYAATPIDEGGAGAHIINMSLGAEFYRQGRGAAALTVALSRATTYATQRGTLVIAAAGNSGIDLDHTANLVSVPAQSTDVVAVSALGPMGWAVPGTAFDLDRPASYTNYGQSAISLGAPGGDFALPGNAACSRPRLPTGSVVNACWVFDMVMAPCRGGTASTTSYCWAAGTSMASPAAAGVAALVVGRYGAMHPHQLRTLLERSSDDLGKPGNDDWYGAGRVNAYRAVTQ